MGLDVKKRDASKLFDPDGQGKRDALLVIAYPSFNVNEMIAVDDAWKAMVKRRQESNSENPIPPVVIFNGELERIFSGYYPPLFYRRLAKVASVKDGGVLASKGSEATYYIKNFKGLNPGILYRCWCVMGEKEAEELEKGKERKKEKKKKKKSSLTLSPFFRLPLPTGRAPGRFSAAGSAPTAATAAPSASGARTKGPA
jgi:hypothetical protein